MKKVLVINNKYKIKGGEDSNIIDEINLLKNKYTVEFLEFDNSKKMSLLDFISLFTNSNLASNKILVKKLQSFNPDAVYVHNLWFVGNLGILKILKKYNMNTLVKIHNFRYHCAKSFFVKKHLNSISKCNACNMSSNSFRLFNKYFNDSYLRSFLLIIGFLYLNSAACSTFTGMPDNSSKAYSPTIPACIDVPHPTINILFIDVRSLELKSNPDKTAVPALKSNRPLIVFLIAEGCS